MAKAPDWIGDAGPGEWVTVASHCTLSRNLSSFPFPARCSEDDLQSVARRVSLAVKGSLPELSEVETAGLDSLDIQRLGETRAVTLDWVHAPAPGRGLFTAPRGDFSVQVNGCDHVTLRAMAAGGGLSRAWERLDAADDALGAALDYAYDARLGHLTSRLNMVGTGLHAGVVLHLPALEILDKTEALEEKLRGQRLVLGRVSMGDSRGLLHDGELEELRPWSDDIPMETLWKQCLLTDTQGAVCRGSRRGDGRLYLLFNQETLGLTEGEIVFRTSHGARMLEEAELEARQQLLQERVFVEDLVHTAAAVARAGRFAYFYDTLGLLSTLRLGMSLGMLPGPGPGGMNRAMIEVQAGHLLHGEGAKAGPRGACERRAALLRGLMGGAGGEN